MILIPQIILGDFRIKKRVVRFVMIPINRCYSPHLQHFDIILN